MAIHPTAIVHDGAVIDASADIGPYCIIGPNVKIGAGTRLIAHVVVDNHTTIGEHNTIFPYASVGGQPQDLKFGGEEARLVIGDHNTIREGATLNIGTAGGDMQTTLGNHCLMMAYSHLAHDCQVGNYVVLANSVALAGHVTVHDHVIIGGLAAVHQFCRIGRNAFIAGGTMVAQDVPPFCIAQGDRAQLAGLNIVGLKRGGWDRERIGALRDGFKSLFQSELPRMLALEETEREVEQEDVRELCAFVRSAKRGVCAPRVGGANHED